ncbi:hypothetical protein ACJMK2_034662 [Sinanodonta woodiana]|uniref:Uncharacterized protein n=1 Tax=Sinanodonta woodiana TaxID=1069815 RepID=A0ABD3WWF4_SINWO
MQEGDYILGEEVREEEEEGDWYENDLQLAAELGKALLERNRELEAQLIHVQQINAEQKLEMEYLTRQLESVKDTMESKNRMYEEVDRNAQEVENINQKLVIDSKADKQRIEKLCSQVERLEEKCDELQKKMEDVTAAERERQRQMKQQNKDTRRARSLANLPDNKENRDVKFEKIHWTYNDNFKNLPLNPYEVEIRNLQEVIKQMKAQQLLDRRKRDDLDTEVALLWEENTSLEIKIRILEEDLVRYKTLQDDIQKIKMEAGRYCIKCGQEITKEEQNKISKEPENDDPEIGDEGKLVKLESGGSLYGNGECLKKVAMDCKETMTAIEPADDPDKSSVSILNELESQYQSLFKKYEALLQKGRRPCSFIQHEDEDRHLAHKEVQTLLKLHRRGDFQPSHGACSTEGEFESPPYKTIFRDIFATLKKSRIEETGETVSTSPMEEQSACIGIKGQSTDGRDK